MSIKKIFSFKKQYPSEEPVAQGGTHDLRSPGTFLGKFFFNRREEKGYELDEKGYLPGRYYTRLKPNWRGPRYINLARWQQDLLFITEQIKCIVNTNAPLVKGIDAVAREENRHRRRALSGFAINGSIFPWLFYGVFFLLMMSVHIANTAFPMRPGGFSPLYYFRVFQDTSFIVWPWTLLIFYPPLIVVLSLLYWQRNLSPQLASVAIRLCVIMLAAFFIVDIFHAMGLSSAYQYVPREIQLLFRDIRYETKEIINATFIMIGIITGAALSYLFLSSLSGRPREVVLLRLRDHLAAGQDLSEAVRRLNRFFPSLYADLIKAGEDTGKLSSCLEALNEDTLSGLNTHLRIRHTCLYLGFVLVVQLTLITFITLKVIPVFQEIIHEYGIENQIPLSDNLAVYFAGFAWIFTGAVQQYPIVLAVLGLFFLLTLFYLRQWSRNNMANRYVASLFLFAPGLRGWFIQRNIALIMLSLDKLVSAGVPLEKALEQSATSAIHPFYVQWLRRLHRYVMDGHSLSEALQSASHSLLVPSACSSMIAVGEHADMLPEALGYLAHYYRIKTDMRTRILVDVMQPLGVLALGMLTLAFQLQVFSLLISLTVLMIEQI